MSYASPGSPVALCDGRGVLLGRPAGRILVLVASTPDGADGDCREMEQPSSAGLLTEPCQDVFKEPGRWIFIL